MQIKVIGSSSAGNCYKISDGKTSLLLEAGLPIKKIKQGCDFDLSSIDGCLISHSHGDHSKSARDVMSAGVELYCSQDTASECALEGCHRLHIIEPLSNTFVGSFQVFSFPVHHDVTNYGYMIYSSFTGENLMFMTDSYYTEHKFKNLNYIMIEANYSNESLAEAENKNRLRRSHMSIENCIEMLKANDLSRVREIWLIHLSSSNADADDFKRRIQELTGCEVYIA